MFNARVHYTVLTQHPNHTLPTRTVSTRIMVRHTKKGIMPQTPNNAPTYKQHYFLFNCAWTTCVTKRHSNTRSCLLSVCFTRTIFNNKSWQHDTRILNQPRVQLHPEKLKLLRKEVIHPHLPVRVPCYDFVPIADPTFDGSLTSLGHRLRVLPTFMT